MPTFRPKTPTIEARRWVGNNDEMREWLDYAFVGIRPSSSSSLSEFLLIDNRTGRVVARFGDWIVRLDDGFYPVEPVKFHAEYEAAT